VRVALVGPRLLRGEEGRSLLPVLLDTGVKVLRAEDSVLRWAGDVDEHQGILMVLERPRHRETDLLSAHLPSLVLVACGVQDPGNLGALARIAEAAWATGMVCAGGGADPFSPRSLRAGAGSLLRIPVVETPDALGAVAMLRRLGLRLVGAMPTARRSYREAGIRAPAALFVGSEGRGLAEETASALDEVVSIPMREGVESLNVAAAAAVLLFEAAARRS
jgi:TrmH family RNA methyltransferase